jgi:hypothetical protein
MRPRSARRLRLRETAAQDQPVDLESLSSTCCLSSGGQPRRHAGSQAVMISLAGLTLGNPDRRFLGYREVTLRARVPEFAVQVVAKPIDGRRLVEADGLAQVLRWEKVVHVKILRKGENTFSILLELRSIVDVVFDCYQHQVTPFRVCRLNTTGRNLERHRTREEIVRP